MNARESERPTGAAKGFLIGPLAGVAVITAWFGTELGGGAGAFVATAIGAAILGYAQALIFGVPAYLILRRRLRPRLSYAALGGGLAASAPFALLTLATEGGLAEVMSVAGPPFVAGIASGAVFWLLAFRRDYADSHGAKGSRDSISS